MPASYSDILLGKLALTNNVVGGDQLRECLNAQEAGKRAGVEQTLAQVLVKRGYITRAHQRELEAARDMAERGRRAKLAIQLLLRHGRPPEDVLKSFYDTLKAQGFPIELSEALEQQGQITPQERSGLDGAVERAFGALHAREAGELARLVEQAAAMPRPPRQPPPGLAPSPYAAMPAGGQRGPYAPQATAQRAAYVPAPQGYPPGYGAPAAAYAQPGYPAPPAPPQYGATDTAPFQRPGGYPPPQAAPAPPWPAPAPAGPGYASTETAPLNRPMSGERVYASPYAAPQDGRRNSPYRPGGAFAHGTVPVRQAVPLPGLPASPVLPPPAPAAPAPPAPSRAAAAAPAYGKTAERAAADLAKLPDWAKTGMRKVEPGALDEPPPSAPDPKLRAEALKEPTGSVPGYEIHEKIGKGTVGVVYRATELVTGRIVALKVLLPIFRKNQTLVERFRREAKLAASLDHPNIRKIYGGGEIGGQLFLSMEYIDGETLQDKIDRHSVLPEAESLRWIAQIARAMDHYVKIGMLHRDLKPANVLVTRDNRALLCDLGISKRVYEDYALTMQGTTLGSPWYLSPEQGMGTDDLDIRSDIYSLGVSLFHCLTGRVPFLGGNAGVIISKHAKEPVPDVRRLNAKVSRGGAALIERMMAKRREDRHQTPKELLAEIAWLRSETGVASTPIVPLDPPSIDESQALAAQQQRARKPGFFRRMLKAVGLG